MQRQSSDWGEPNPQVRSRMGADGAVILLKGFQYCPSDHRVLDSYGRWESSVYHTHSGSGTHRDLNSCRSAWHGHGLSLWRTHLNCPEALALERQIFVGSGIDAQPRLQLSELPRE